MPSCSLPVCTLLCILAVVSKQFLRIRARNFGVFVHHFGYDVPARLAGHRPAVVMFSLR